MASGDAVAPTALDRPQCFIEKEKACFPCRELVCLSSRLFSWRRRMRDHNEWYIVSIYVHILTAVYCLFNISRRNVYRLSFAYRLLVYIDN